LIVVADASRMRATLYHGPEDIRVDDVPRPAIESPTDAIFRITHGRLWL